MRGEFRSEGPDGGARGDAVLAAHAGELFADHGEGGLERCDGVEAARVVAAPGQARTRSEHEAATRDLLADR